MTQASDNGSDLGPTPSPRKSQRVGLSADVVLRRSGNKSYRVKVLDLSPHGCKAEFVERPNLDELVRVKFEDLEALEAVVCWIRGFEMGLEFERPIYPAVFDMLVARLNS